MCAVKAPGFGDNRKSQLRDMAISTGAVVSDVIAVMFTYWLPPLEMHKAVKPLHSAARLLMLLNLLLTNCPGPGCISCN